MTRRKFNRLAATIPLAAAASHSAQGAAREQNDYAGGLTDIAGIKVGHATESSRPTGCTVILCEGGAVAGVGIRGAAPGTRDIELLDPVNTVPKIHAVVLSGGSAFGLETASGAMRYLEEKGIGFKLADHLVPIVPAAILFDLGVGGGKANPGAEQGYQACRNATSGQLQEGNLGAGAGATVGKLLGRGQAMKGGLGSLSIKVGELTVAALAVSNCVGDVHDPQSGEIIAGARKGARSGELADAAKLLRSRRLDSSGQPVGESTILGVVATNAALDKAQAKRVALMAHDGLARVVRPAHTPFDGDTIFALSLGELSDFNLGQVGFLAAEAFAGAIVRSVKSARSIPGYPAHQDLARVARRSG